MKKTIIIFVLLLFLNGILLSADIYGINTHVWGPTVLQKVKEAKIGWIRVDASWNEIEEKKGFFNYSRLDQAINYAANNGLKVLCVLAYTPSWANGGKSPSYPPLDVSYWRRFVSTTVKRYKGKVHYWAVWNEPNLKGFFVGSPTDYLEKILTPAGQEIRKADPNAKIVAPEISYSTAPESRWDTYMKAVLNKGKSYIDIVSIHIYDNRGAEAIMKKIEEGDAVYPSVVNLKTITGYGGKELWLTETGWTTAVVTEDQQATNYFELLKRVLNSPSVDRVFFYEIKDIENVSYYGILKSNNTPKKAFYTYKNFIANESDFIEDDSDDEKERKKACAYSSFIPYQRELIRNLREEKKRYLTNDISRENVKFYYELSSKYEDFLNKKPMLKKKVSKLLIRWGSVFLSMKREKKPRDFELLVKDTIKFLSELKGKISDREKKSEISRGIRLLEIYQNSSPERMFYDFTFNIKLKELINKRRNYD